METFTGIFIPPKTGTYQFIVSSDDESQVYLKRGLEVPVNEKSSLVLNFERWTHFKQWNTFPAQNGMMLNLTEGIPYYFKALHKQG